MRSAKRPPSSLFVMPRRIRSGRLAAGNLLGLSRRKRFFLSRRKRPAGTHAHGTRPQTERQYAGSQPKTVLQVFHLLFFNRSETGLPGITGPFPLCPVCRKPHPKRITMYFSCTLHVPCRTGKHAGIETQTEGNSGYGSRHLPSARSSATSSSSASACGIPRRTTSRPR